MASFARPLAAIGCAALLMTAACSDLFGLAPKEEAPADASTVPGTEAGEDSATPPDDATLPDEDAPSTGDDDGGGSTRDAARPDAAKGDAGGLDADNGCSAMGPVPDGAPETFYGSCVPHITPTSVICNQYGYTGNLGVTPQTVATQKSLCTTNQKGTWTDGPCDKTGAIFGCESVDDTGYVCEDLSITWYFPPATVANEGAVCPSSVGTVIPP